MIAFSILVVLYLSSLLVRALLARSYANALPPIPDKNVPAGALTIVQPILSGDPLLEETLQTNLDTLPGQVFFWLLDEEDTEGLRIVNNLKRSCPQIDIEILVCTPCPDRVNPKIWKLQQAAMRIQTPYFCVLDDDTTLPQATACALMNAGDHMVATGLPCYLDAGTIASRLLAQFVNNNSVFTYLGSSRLVEPFTLNGMGYLMRRESLKKIDYFTPIQSELTDDLALATLVVQQQGRIYQAASPLIVRTGVKSLRHYVQMMHRWYVFVLLLMKKKSAKVQGLVFILHGLPPLLFLALFIAAFTSPSPIRMGMLAVLLGIRTWVLINVQQRFFKRRLHRPLLSVVSELLQPFHLMHALFYRTIRWRIRRYRVRDTNDYWTV